MTTSHPSRAPVPFLPRRWIGRVALRNGLVVAAALTLLVVLLAGCGATPLPSAAPSTIAPTTPAPPPPTTTVPPTTVPPSSTHDRTTTLPRPSPARPTTSRPRPEATATIWPARDAAAAARLQRDVDGGRQPWLLDPEEVVISYVGAELGYRNPEVFGLGPGRFEVQDGQSPAAATITLAQTVRRGAGGIWLVTGVQRR